MRTLIRVRTFVTIFKFNAGALTIYNRDFAAASVCYVPNVIVCLGSFSAQQSCFGGVNLQKRVIEHVNVGNV